MYFAVLGDSSFIKRISRGKFMGVVHSVFERTINLEDQENGELYTIGSRSLDNAPNTIIADIHGFRQFGIQPGMGVSTDGNAIHIEKLLSISVENAAFWISRLPVYPKDTAILTGNVARLKSFIDTFGKAGGMKDDPNNATLFGKEISRLLKERSKSLVMELSEGKIGPAIESARGIIGLGPGLTPSGDDFLTGMLAAFSIQDSPAHTFSEFGRQVVEIARPLTNVISWTALQKASQGLVRESTISLIQAVLYGNEDDLFKALNEVLKIGSTSGTDMALGLAAGFEINLLYN
ncbi:DUF2877 domain-containing protein [Bacillus sp. FJAT-27445]|uniref:DUF2877 domain-containing protein n=1 Tax=Bacillus sp. FJAT-27445 TaxID=1679166 RepID=UPI0007435C40|nr:DUF2877 domain-containing protein [Bacillus sp. FJAT-27445]